MITTLNCITLALNSSCSAVVLVHGIFRVNNMTKHTAFPMRMAWLFLTTGSLALLLSPWFDVQFSWGGSFLVWGFAVHVLAERRGNPFQSQIFGRHR